MWKTKNPTSPPFSLLNRLRDQIEKIDESLLALLAQLMILAKQIGDYKKSAQIQVEDPDREAELLARYRQTHGLDPEFIEKLFKEIFEESRKVQK